MKKEIRVFWFLDSCGNSDKLVVWFEDWFATNYSFFCAWWLASEANYDVYWFNYDMIIWKNISDSFDDIFNWRKYIETKENLFKLTPWEIKKKFN